MAPPLAFGLELDELDDDEEAAETAQKACGHWVQSRGTENWHSFPSSQSGHDGVPSSHCTQPVCRAKRLGYEPVRASEVSNGSWAGEARLLLRRIGTTRCNRSTRRPGHNGWSDLDYTFFYDRHRDVRQGTVGWVRRDGIESTLLVVDSIGLVCEKIDKLVSKVTADPGRGSDRFDHKGQTDGALSAGAWRGCLFFK